MSKSLSRLIKNSKDKFNKGLISLATGAMLYAGTFGLSNKVYAQEQITIPVGTTPYSVAIKDANNDGYNDIITANANSNNVSFLKWNGTNFDSQIVLPVGIHPVSMAIGDVDNDGDNDIITANQTSDDISLIRWNGTNFDSSMNVFAGSKPTGVVIADVDNDGKNEVVTANYTGNNVSVLRWNGTTFDSPITYPTDSYPHSVAVGDVNSDGRNDIVTANYLPKKVSILLGNGTGFNPSPALNVGDSPTYVVIADADNDGDNDIVVANSAHQSGASGISNISLIKWNGTNFDPQTQLTAGHHIDSVVVGDVNNDGYNDIACTNRNDNTISLIRWNGNNFDPQIVMPVGTYPISVGIGDANNDGCNDVVVANSTSNNISLFYGTFPKEIYLNPKKKINKILELIVGKESYPITLHLSPGIYNENVTMNPWENIIGDDKEKSVIAGSIKCADNSSLANLTIRNLELYSTNICVNSANVSPVVYNTIIDGNGNPLSLGVLVSGASSLADISSNTLINHHIGVQLNNSEANFEKNTMKNSEYGIWYFNTIDNESKRSMELKEIRKGNKFENIILKDILYLNEPPKRNNPKDIPPKK